MCLFLIHVFICLPHEYAHISIILFRVFLNFRRRYNITQILLHLFIQPHSCKTDLISHFIAYTNIFYIHVSSWWTFTLFPLSVRKKVHSRISLCTHTTASWVLTLGQHRQVLRHSCQLLQRDCSNFHSQPQCMNFLWIHFPINTSDPHFKFLPIC